MERSLVLGRIIREYIEREDALVERDLRLPAGRVPGKAITVVGPRRSGKTCLLLSLFQRARGSPRLFLPLDDDRLFPPSLADLDASVRVLGEIAPGAKGAPLVFLDEVQEVAGWELFVKRAAEREGAQVYVTGSSSKLLSREIATQLRGRTLTFELFPFSFREVMRLKGLRPERFPTSAEEAMLKGLARDYLAFGGFPEVVLKEEKRKTLSEYADVMFYRDLVERHKVKNLKVARVFFNLLFASFAKEISVNRMYGFMRSQGLRTSRNILYNYLEHLHDAYLVFPLRRFSGSLKEVEQSIPKMYAVDNGLAGVFGADPEEGMGRLMENAVFMEMRKGGLVENRDVFYYRSADGREADFAVRRGKRFERIVQVCYDVSDIGTKEREVKGLLKASEELGCSDLTMVTWDREGEEKAGTKTIRYVPLWKWLAGGGCAGMWSR